MPSPDAIPVARSRIAPLVVHELRELWLGGAFWGALLVDVLLTGYSYVQAAALYAEPSRTAATVPELARGLSPLDGIVVPTLGALYLVVTLLYPLVVVRTIGAEKQHGSWKLLVQLPYSMPALITAKLVAAGVAWSFLLLPGLTALGFWKAAGGHIGGWETANVLLGHALYACVVTGIALAAASLTNSIASAAIGALAITLGCWVLDFAAAAGESQLAKQWAAVSLTHLLRSFERGIFSAAAVVGALCVGLTGATIAGIWLAPGRTKARRIVTTVAVALLALGLLAAVAQVRVYADASEDRRNSFALPDEIALRSLDRRLRIRVHLAATDPRLYDLERSVLGKLRRAMPDVVIEYPVDPDSGRDASYGLVTYDYAGRQADSRSTSEEEILPLIFGLAGAQRPARDQSSDYPGYPLVATTRGAEVAFYFVGPALVLSCWALARGGWRRLRRFSPWIN